MVFIDGETVTKHLDMARCISLMRETLMSDARGETVQPLRSVLRISEGKLLGIMPAAINRCGVAGAKLLTVFPDNYKRKLPSHQGVVVLFDTHTGAIRAVVDAEAVTAIRTPAVSAVATDALARTDAHVLCLLGSGLQARRHIDAICCVREIREVRVWDIDREAAGRFAQEMSKKHGIPVLDCSDSVQQAVCAADVVCTVTAAQAPILFGAHLSPGTHINAVGACTPAARELDGVAVRMARFFGDSAESVLNEAGDFLIPLRAGEIAQTHLLGEIGAVLAGRLPGRLTDEDVTVFEALGLAVEDLAAADYVLQKVEAEGT